MASLRVRVLCDGCEAAQASHWCVAERRSLCARCAANSTTRGSRVALPQPAAVLPLCHMCRTRPATRKSQIEALALCQECRHKCIRAKYRNQSRSARSAARPAGSGSGSGSGSGGSSSDDHQSHASFSRESSTE